MKTKNLRKTLMGTLLLLIFSCSFIFTGCFALEKETEKLINTPFEKIVYMQIKSVKDNKTYMITDAEKMQEIYQKYSVVGLQEKEKSGPIFSELPNQGEPAYYIHISYLETPESESHSIYSISVNITYTDYWETTIDKYYLQRRKATRIVYFTETTVNEYDYFKNLYDYYKLQNQEE